MNTGTELFIHDSFMTFEFRVCATNQYQYAWAELIKKFWGAAQHQANLFQKF